MRSALDMLGEEFPEPGSSKTGLDMLDEEFSGADEYGYVRPPQTGQGHLSTKTQAELLAAGEASNRYIARQQQLMGGQLPFQDQARIAEMFRDSAGVQQWPSVSPSQIAQTPMTGGLLGRPGDEIQQKLHALYGGGAQALVAAGGLVDPGWANEASQDIASRIGYEPTPLNKITAGAGNAGAFLATMPLAGPVGPAALGFAAGAGGTRMEVDQLRQQGQVISPDDEWRAAILSGLTEGATELVSAGVFKMMSRVGGGALDDFIDGVRTGNKMKVMNTIGRVSTVAGVEIPQNVAEEVAATLIQNQIARQYYDPSRKPGEGVQESAYGGLGGGGMTTVAAALSPRDQALNQAASTLRQAADALDKATSPATPEGMVRNAAAFQQQELEQAQAAPVVTQTPAAPSAQAPLQQDATSLQPTATPVVAPPTQVQAPAPTPAPQTKSEPAHPEFGQQPDQWIDTEIARAEHLLTQPVDDYMRQTLTTRRDELVAEKQRRATSPRPAPVQQAPAPNVPRMPPKAPPPPRGAIDKAKVRAAVLEANPAADFEVADAPEPGAVELRSKNGVVLLDPAPLPKITGAEVAAKLRRPEQDYRDEFVRAARFEEPSLASASDDEVVDLLRKGGGLAERVAQHFDIEGDSVLLPDGRVRVRVNNLDDIGTLRHEIVHAAEKLGIISEEDGALIRKRFTDKNGRFNREGAAQYTERLTRLPALANSRLGRAVLRVIDFGRRLRHAWRQTPETEQAVTEMALRKLATGEVWRGKPKKGKKARGDRQQKLTAVIASPSIEEKSKYRASEQHLREGTYEQKYRGIEQAVRDIDPNAKFMRGIGDWKDGAEPTSMTIMDADSAADAEYVASRAGVAGAERETAQKQVIYAQEDANGSQTLLRIPLIGKTIYQVRRMMADAGIQYKTIVRDDKDPRMVYAVVFDAFAPLEQSGEVAKMRTIADATGRPLEAVRVEGRFLPSITSSDRGAAHDYFRQTIDKYEAPFLPDDGRGGRGAGQTYAELNAAAERERLRSTALRRGDEGDRQVDVAERRLRSSRPRPRTFIHYSDADRTGSGLSREFAGSRYAGEEMRRGAKVVHVYTPQAVPETMIASGSVKHIIRGDFKVLSAGSLDAKIITSLIRRAYPGITPQEIVLRTQEFAQQYGFDGYERISNGFVQLWRDVAPDEVELPGLFPGVDVDRQQKLVEKRPSPNVTARAVLPHLRKDDAEWVRGRRGNAVAVMDVFRKLDDDKYFEAIARAGIAKKGWYREAAEVLTEMFSVDAPRFVGLLAATSPRQTVAMNLREAANAWADWVAAGRPTDRPTIESVLSKSITLNARFNNAVTALAEPDRELSGMKVDSFKDNLLGDLYRATLDVWMAKFAGIEHANLSSRAVYVAYSAKMARVAQKMGFEPAEVQETIWSFFKTLSEMAKRGGSVAQALEDIRHENIIETPDFVTLLLEDQNVREKLAKLGYVARAPAGRGGQQGTRGAPAYTGRIEIGDPSISRRVARRAGAAANVPVKGPVQTRAFDSAGFKPKIKPYVKVEKKAKAPEPTMEIPFDGDRAHSLKEKYEYLWPDYIRTPEFKRFFGNSKVVNEATGEPLMVYHATTADKEFTVMEPGTSAAIFFADNPLTAVNSASRFHLTEKDRWGETDVTTEETASVPNMRVISAYLRISNPKVFKMHPAIWSMPGQENTRIEAAKALGHDGVIFVNEDTGQKLYAILDSSQAKSAIGNRGTYDRTDRDIMHSLKPDWEPYNDIGHGDPENSRIWWYKDGRLSVMPVARKGGAGTSHMNEVDLEQATAWGRIDEKGRRISFATLLDSDSRKLGPVHRALRKRYRGYAVSVTAGPLGEAQRDTAQYSLVPNQKEILDNVRMEHPPEPTVPQQIKVALSKHSSVNFEVTWLDKVRTSVQDKLWPVMKAVQRLRAGKQLLPEDDPELLLRALGGLAGNINRQHESGLRDANGNKLVDGVTGRAKNDEWLLGAFRVSSEKDLVDDMYDAASLGIAERTVEKAKQLGRADRISGIGAGMTDLRRAGAFLREIRKDKPRHDRAKEALRRYRSWADDMLQYLEDSGWIDAKQHKAIKDSNDYYLNMQRVLERQGTPVATGANILPKFRGSIRLMDNPWVNLLAHTDKMINAAEENRAWAAFVNLIGATNPDIGKQVRKGTRDSIVIRVDGEEQSWLFHPDVHDSIEGFSRVMGRELGGILSIPGRASRWLVTRSPSFMIRNMLFRDPISRAVLSNTGSKPWDIFAGFTDEELEDFEVSGGANFGHFKRQRSEYHRELAKKIKELTGDESTILMLPKRAGKAWSHLSELSETAGRMAEYRRALRHAKTVLGYNDRNAKLYAAGQARGLLDFAISGTLIDTINRLAYIPFLNAQIQGLTRTIQAVKNNPGRTAARWSMYVLAPALAAYGFALAGGEDDEKEYLQLPSWRRDMFWNFKVGQMYVSVPKPFELGVAASGVERMIDRVRGNKRAFEGYAKSAVGAVAPFGDDVLGGPFKSIIEGMVNYSFFYDRAIVPAWEARLALDLRDTTHASSLGQALQKASQTLGYGIDARKFDNFITSVAGGTGNLAKDISDIGREDRSASRFLASGTGIATVPPGYAAVDVQRAMEQADELGDNRALENLARLIRQAGKASTLSERNRILKDARREAADLREFYDKFADKLHGFKRDKMDEDSAQRELKALTPSGQRGFVQQSRPMLRRGKQHDAIWKRIGELREQWMKPDATPQRRQYFEQQIERLLERSRMAEAA